MFSQLTEHGRSTLAEMDRGHREAAELLFGDMPGHRFDAFVEGLEHVVSRLRAGLEAERAGRP